MKIGREGEVGNDGMGEREKNLINLYLISTLFQVSLDRAFSDLVSLCYYLSVHSSALFTYISDRN